MVSIVKNDRDNFTITVNEDELVLIVASVGFSSMQMIGSDSLISSIIALTASLFNELDTLVGEETPQQILTEVDYTALVQQELEKKDATE